MRYLDLTLPTEVENLALDEALLDEAEAADDPAETLRIWEPQRPMVVVGRSSRLAEEVHQDQCRRDGVHVLRRSSGGAAVVTGPGCLMYAVVLDYARRPLLRAVDHAHHFVLRTLVGALGALVPSVRCQGTSDLVAGDRKFSGNSLRCKRQHLLYHGTLLYDFRLELIDRYLAMPPRQPDYRSGRSHGDFVANLPLEAEAIREALRTAWDAREPCDPWPRRLTEKLAAEKFSQTEWNARR